MCPFIQKKAVFRLNQKEFPVFFFFKYTSFVGMNEKGFNMQ